MGASTNRFGGSGGVGGSGWNAVRKGGSFYRPTVYTGTVTNSHGSLLVEQQRSRRDWASLEWVQKELNIDLHVSLLYVVILCVGSKERDID